MATLGYVRGSNGPDLARVYPGEQIVSHVFPNTTGETLRITHISAWVGNWGGTATMRFGIWAASSSSAAPGALLAQTVEFSPTINYMDGGGGQLRTVALESPYNLEPGQVICLGASSRNNSAGIAMYQAADPALSGRPNRDIYRKNFTGENLVSASGSSSSYEGHLAIYVTGTTNQAPYTPVLSSPVGTISDGNLSPTLRFVHRDPNGDRSSRLHVQVRERDNPTPLLSDRALDASINNQSVASVPYTGASLRYYVSYQWRARTRDVHGEWGEWSDWTGFLVRHKNHAPNQPSNVTGTGTNNSRDIVVQADFTDPDYPTLPDGTNYEWFDAKHVYVMRVSDNVNVVNTGIVSVEGSQRTNNRSYTAYTLPAWNTEYIHHERHRDRRGAWSDWIAHQIRARSGPSVDAPWVPSGRITDPTNPGPIGAIYRNSAGLNTNAIQYELRSSTGALIRSSPVYSRSVAPDGVIENTWIATEFGTLANGTEYRIVVRARDTAGNWSPPDNYSTIVTNARPGIPTLRYPASGRVASAIPELSVAASDPDQPSSELTVQLEAYTESETLISAHAMVHSPEPGKDFIFTLDASAFVSGYGTYKWRARSYDGHLYSNWSSMWTFTYAAVPSVTITAPTGPEVSTSQPVLNWTSTGQTHWRVRGYDNDRLVYDTGQHTGTTTSHTISGSQYWIGGERWNNHETFQWLVSVRDASTLWGDSELLELTLEYIAPAPLIITGEAMSLEGVKGTHYGQISWTQTEYTEAEFLYYDLDRAEITGPGGDLQGEYIGFGEYKRVHNSAETELIDFDVTSNQWYRVGLKQSVQQGVDVIESEPVYVEFMVSWHGTLLHMPFDPINNYIWLNYGANEYRPTRNRRLNAVGTAQPSGYRAPIGYTGSARQVNPSGEYTFIAREDMSHIQQLDELDRIYENQFADTSPDGRPHIICWREGRGGRKGRLYVALLDFEDVPSVGTTTQGVMLQFEERYYRVGASLEGGEQ